MKKIVVAALLRIALAVVPLSASVVLAVGVSAQANPAPGVSTSAADPRAEVDAICKQVNDWLAANNFPERIDCEVLPTEIEGACVGINAQLIDARLPIRYHCPTRRIVPVSPQAAAAACAQANDYLATNGLLTRIDCANFPDFIEGACDAINDFLSTNAIPARYECAARAVVPTAVCKGRPATIAGTTGKDVIAGTDGPDVIVALEGADEVRAGGGDDLVCGGKGRDRISGGSGGDRLHGEAGKDRLIGGKGQDILKGGKGKDDEKR